MIVAHGLVGSASVSVYVIATLVLVEVAAGACGLFNTTVLPPIAYVIWFTTEVNVMLGVANTVNVPLIDPGEKPPDAAWENVIVAIPGIAALNI